MYSEMKRDMYHNMMDMDRDFDRARMDRMDRDIYREMDRDMENRYDSRGYGDRMYSDRMYDMRYGNREYDMRGDDRRMREDEYDSRDPEMYENRFRKDGRRDRRFNYPRR